MTTIPEFLCFRYKGLKRPEQILGEAKKVGWKFRKWQNWEQIYIEPSDKYLLKKCGDALVDHTDFEIEDFGRISEILLKVASWRKDSKSMSAPPDILPAWNALDDLLMVFMANPAAVAVKMQRDLGGVDGVAKTHLLDVFYWHLLTEFFQKLNLPGLTSVTFVRPWDLKTLEGATSESIRALYKSVGLTLPITSSDPKSRKLVSRCYKDLGFSEPVYDLDVPWEAVPTTAAVCRPLVCYESLGSVELIQISHRETTLLLRINKDHALVKATDRLSPKDVLELLLTAYAEAVAALPNKQEELGNVSTLLAMKARNLLANRE
jgi:hypothetical protein